MRTSTGMSTEAVFIFNNMLRKLSRSFQPEYLVAVFESLTQTLREQEFAAYKANRVEMPEDLGPQIAWVRRLLEAMRIPMLQVDGYEADDVIGTLACRAEEAGFDVMIVSSDKDLLQLVTDHISMLNPAKEDKIFDPAGVKEFMGVEPRQVADLLALKGDAVDNIPGAPGIGDKGAKGLIDQFGSVEAALDRAGEIQRKMYRESLEQNRERIELSKRLATIETKIPLEFSIEAFRTHPEDPAVLRQVYKELEFTSQLKELGAVEDSQPRDLQRFETEAELDAWLQEFRQHVQEVQTEMVLAVTLSRADTAGSNPALLEGEIGLAWRGRAGRSVPFRMFGRLQSVLEDPKIQKTGENTKTLRADLQRLGLKIENLQHDLSIYGFLLDADPGSCSLDAQVLRRMDIKLSGGADERAMYLIELLPMLRAEIETRGLGELYGDLELPLVPVLGRMEETGILVDAVELQRLSGLMEREIARLTTRIHEISGKEFNIASPQQLGRVLFEDLKLPAPRAARGKAVSTAADVLEELAAEHEIAKLVLEHRQLSKLKGTYVDALPQLIDRHTGRIHTRFNQTGAATGRVSSSDPNLQNIPVKTELGREIRAAFVPRPGWVLLVADYSQIELRLLAHMSKDPVLMDAFRRGEDIHTRTASEVLGVPPMLVTREARNSAKAVNFGIVYGISGFGLAAQLGIPRKEAEEYIRNYFARYAGVRRFVDETIAEVRQTGMARTLLGRQRAIPDMNSRNPNARGFAERIAVNTPLQGTAADLVKLAMIRIDRKLEGRHAKMLLQVHDELVFEAPPEEVDEVAQMVKQEMEGVYALEVPLIAEVGRGPNWRDAK